MMPSKTSSFTVRWIESGTISGFNDIYWQQFFLPNYGR
jgi:hypothetical protein